MLILDTDIGSDVDDAMALGVVMGSPELHPFSITTVYGDTELRARLASRLISLSSKSGATRILAGRQETLSGKHVWWAGHEGSRYSDLDREPFDSSDAVEYMVSAAAEHPGEVDVLAIGPLTDIAACLDVDPSFSSNLRRLVVMGGDFRHGPARVAEHNIASDVAAAQRVFESELDITIGGLDLTTQLRVGPTVVDRIAEAGPFGAAIAEEIAEWLAFHGETENTPHDPILATYLVRPDLFRTRRAYVTVGNEGVTEERSSAHGPVKIVAEMNALAVLDEIARRICEAR